MLRFVKKGLGDLEHLPAGYAGPDSASFSHVHLTRERAFVPREDAIRAQPLNNL
jgi:hypothetical protein